MTIQTPEDIEGKSVQELQKLHREISFQLKIVNNALKDHTREMKIRKFFERYPYYIGENNLVVKADVENILATEQAGFGYDQVGLPVWGPTYGLGGNEFICLEKEDDLQKTIKLRSIIDEVISLHNQKTEPYEKKTERVNKILEGFSV